MKPTQQAASKKIDWSKRLAALRKRRGESKAMEIVASLLEDWYPRQDLSLQHPDPKSGALSN